MSFRISRRTFLRGAGGIAVGLPLLNAMEVRGQPLEGPRRFGTFLVMSSPVVAKWWPTGADANFTLQPTLASLEPVKSKLTFLKGIAYRNADVNLGFSDDHHKVLSGMLTGSKQLRGQFYLNAGWASGVSLDQYLAEKIGKDPIRSLVVAPGLTGRDDVTRTSYRAASAPVDPYNNPAQVWDVLFKDFTAGTSAESQTALEAIRRRRASVLDAVKSEYAALSSRVGTEDRQKLEAHVESIRSLEKRVTAAAEANTSACTAPARPTSYTSYPDNNYNTVMKLHLDMLVHAFVCDRTRVMSMQTARGVSQMSFPWLNINLKQHDEINHNGANFNLLDPISKWYAEQFAYLCTELDKHKEGSRSVLDNSLIWLTYEHDNANNHTHDSVPMILAGSAAGRVRTGRVMSFNKQPHNNLMVSILNAMGVPDTRFGDAEFCTGPLAGLAA